MILTTYDSHTLDLLFFMRMSCNQSLLPSFLFHRLGLRIVVPSKPTNLKVSGLPLFLFIPACISQLFSELAKYNLHQPTHRFCFPASVPRATNFWGKVFAFKVAVSNTLTKCVATICYGSWCFQLLVSCFAIQQLGQCHLFCSFVTPAPSLWVLISASEGISSLCCENKISMP